MENQPKRKQNRLKHYDYSQNGIYFVTICVKGHQPLLGTVVGGDAHIAPHVELSDCGRVVEKYVRSIPGVGKYCIMPNHIHMIIEIQDPETGPMWASAPTQALPQRIRPCKTLVSKELGTSIFQRSYYDHVIRNEADFLRIWQYIDENPLKWQLDCYFTP